MKLTIERSIIDLFPDVAIGIVVARSLDNKGSNTEVANLLRSAEADSRQRFEGKVLSEHPTIQSWRQAYKKFKAGDYKSSVENLTKRVVKGGTLPTINSLVDLYNVISLQYVFPVGGEDLDHVSGNIVLTVAKGDEEFIPLLETENNPPLPGEVVYRDAETVLCRKWNWRESDKTKLIEDTKNAIFVIESVLAEDRDRMEKATRELAQLLEAFCEAKTSISFLDRENFSFDLGMDSI